jgi:hypothetical protein
MNKSTTGIVILGLALTIGAGLFIGGCSYQKQWWCMFAIIPSLVAVLSAHGLNKTKGDQPGESCDTFDGWLFFLVMCLTSVIAVPLLLFHLYFDDYKYGALAMQLVGSVLVTGGFVTFLICQASGDPDGF